MSKKGKQGTQKVTGRTSHPLFGSVVKVTDSRTHKSAKGSGRNYDRAVSDATRKLAAGGGTKDK